jgi:hypothetical protein
VQFFSSPKYALNTYAVVPIDPWPLRIIFAMHEYVYIFHIWVHQASSIVLCEVFAVTYTHIIRAITDVMRRLSEEGELKEMPLLDLDEFKRSRRGSSAVKKDNLKRRKRNSRPRSAFEEEQITMFIPDRILDPQTIAPGTEYTIMSLLHDYKKVMMVSREFNNWAGKLMGGTTMSNYGQVIHY